MSDDTHAPVHVSQRVGQLHDKAAVVGGRPEDDLPEAGRQGVLLDPAVDKHCHQLRAVSAANKSEK